MNLELVKKIGDLDKKGFLRDEIFKEISKDNNEIIKQSIVPYTLPNKLFFLFRGYLSCKKHLEERKKDIVSQRQLLRKKAKLITELRYLSRKEDRYEKYLKDQNLSLLLSLCQRYLLKNNR